MHTLLRFKYNSYEFGDIDIHLKSLKDKNQFSDADDVALKLGISSAQWSIFGVVWDSGMALAHEMVNQKIAEKLILEVGCGIAVASHVLNARGGNITATDYHPTVGTFLKDNTKLNEQQDIPFVLEDWNTEESKLGRFDLIIGSDLLYEVPQIELLSSFLVSHANEKCEIILVDPKRGNANNFTRAMEKFGFVHHQKKSSKMPDFKGNIHYYQKG